MEKKNIFEEIKSWIQILIIAALIAFVLNSFIIANSEVPSGSMEPTITTHSRILGSRLSYSFGDINRGDVAIFVFGWRCPSCSEPVEGEHSRFAACPFCGETTEKRVETVYYVKRVIGVPGDVIDIVKGKVYLNQSEVPLDEPYLAEEMRDHTTYHFEVPQDGYFMMGDNRNCSNDARFWSNPYVQRKKMIAKVGLAYYPKLKQIH